MKSILPKILVVLAIAALVMVFFAFDLGQYLRFDYLKSRQSALETFYAGHQLMTMALYMAIYILVAALSLPGAAVMTLAGGAIFGFWFGLLLVSFASTIGVAVIERSSVTATLRSESSASSPATGQRYFVEKSIFPPSTAKRTQRSGSGTESITGASWPERLRKESSSVTSCCPSNTKFQRLAGKTWQSKLA